MWSRIWQDSYWRCGSNLEDSKMFHNKSSPIQTSIRHLFHVGFVLILICKSTFTGITSLLAICLILTLYKHEPSDALIHYWRLSIFHDIVWSGTNTKSGKKLRLSEQCFPVVKHLLPSTYLRYWLIQDLFMWRTYVFIGTLGAVQVSCD